MIDITTRMEIAASAEDIFDSFVNPEKIGNFWFSRASEIWEKGKKITLSYDEFDAKVPIQVLELRQNRQIRFVWGTSDDERVVTITIAPSGDKSAVEVKEAGFQEAEAMLSNPALAEIRTYEYEEIIEHLLGQKEGWTFVLTCLKAYLENGVNTLRMGLLR